MTLFGSPLPAIVPLAELLSAGLAANPDQDAVVSRDVRWTFRALDTASDRLAAAYSGLGLAPGDRIASLMPNRGALLVHYLACVKGRYVAVPLNYRYTPREIDHALEKSGTGAVFYHTERADDLRRSRVASGLAGGHILYGQADGAAGPRFEDLIEKEGNWISPPVHDDDPAFILFTSGSTGPAKGVTHTHGSMSWMLASVAAGFELTGNDILLPASSMSHLGALLFSLAALSAGARVVVARNFVAGEMLPLLRAERPSVLCMLPAALFGLIRDDAAKAEDFASLRLVRSGSDKVPEELEAEFTQLTGLEIDEGYGCTEVGLATLNPLSGRITAGSIGKPLPAFALSVRSDEGSELPVGAEGNLWIRTPSLMRGYWDDDEATAKVIFDGWLDSGDCVQADPDGYLWFRGRKKQIIVHDGSNIFPQEVEDALLAHPDVESAGVIGVHDLLHGENVRAYVVAKRGRTPSAHDLIEFARERVGYKAPEEIAFLESMPLNPTGKTDRVRLKAMAAERNIHAAA